MEERVRKNYLYDFYGELLTEHQKKIYEESTFDDLSLAEIAEGAGVSRQAVHDIIKRTDASLEEYEAKLHMLERFMEIKNLVKLIKDEADFCNENDGHIEKIIALTKEIEEKL